MKTKIYAFDFDGTLTTKDTLLEFIKYVHGSGKLTLTFLLFSPVLVLMKLRLYPNWLAKQQVFAWLFKGMTIEEFDNHCRNFAKDNMVLLRPKGMDCIRRALAEGTKVIVISASIENWVKPFFEEFGDQVLVSCTRIDVRKGVVTGKFLTKNCYGEEKVKRLTRAFPYRKTYELTAFGDSHGDDKMFEYADERHYKPFRQ